MSTSALYTHLLQANKHTWWKKVTPSHHQKVLRANQIQYQLQKLDDGCLQVQAINILNNFQNSLGPEILEGTQSALLMAVISKKWILAETLPMAQNHLSAQKLSLFCGYILYYDLIMDHLLLEKDEILKDWLLVEKNTYGHHHHTLDPTNFNHDFDEKNAIHASCSCWGITQLYNRGGNMTKLDEEEIQRMRRVVLHWFENVPCDGGKCTGQMDAT